MEIKRPFSDEDFQATPKPVQQYIIQLEGLVIKLLNETENVKILAQRTRLWAAPKRGLVCLAP